MRTKMSLLLLALLVAGLTGCGDPVDRAVERGQVFIADIEVGSGRTVSVGDHVTATVRAWVYADGGRGREVEIPRPDPAGFIVGVGAVMPGWDEGLIGMLEGGERRLVVGPDGITPAFRPAGVAAGDALWCEIRVTEIARIEATDLAAGDGPAVAAGDYVRIEYVGWDRQDGDRDHPFISSETGGEPAGVMVGAGMVIPGLDLGLAGMRVGGRRRIVVPPALAYGDRGRAPIGPGATLIYEVELVARPEVAVEVLREGAGEPVRAGQRVTFHLAGWLVGADGAKGERFQDSRRAGGASTVILGSFKIQPGLEVGIPGMLPGELRRLQVPAAMAFGGRGWHRGDRTLVPPDADVIYEVELVGTPARGR